MRAAGASKIEPELAACFHAFDAEFDFVYRLLRRHGANAADADDLAQEVFLVVWRRWRDYDPARPLRPWLAGITFRIAHDHFRRSRREVPSGFVDGEEPASPLDHLAAARARALVVRALGALSERHRTIMILHELEGIPMPELAATLGVPATTLYGRLKKAQELFARAVRRLQREAPGEVSARDAEALLAIERTLQTQPAARRRVMERLRALALAPAAPPAPARSGRWPLAIAVGAALLVASLVAVRARPTRPPAAAHRLAARPASQVMPSLDEGLVGYWRFDEGAGRIARDRSGHGTDCLMQQLDPSRPFDPSRAWTDGPLAGALALNGQVWLSCARPRLAETTGLTVSLWVKHTRAQVGYHALVTRQDGGGNLDQFYVGLRGDELFLVSHIWGGKLAFRAPPVGRWFHLAMVRAPEEVVLFVDGTAVMRRPASDARPATSDNPLIVGAGLNGDDPTAATQRFIGAVDELAIYDRPLSDAEVHALAHGVQPRAR